MQFTSTQKYVRTSPRKLREVAHMVKGMKPAQAVETLPFVHKRSSLVLAKVIKTSLANAAQKGISGEDLKFKEIQINEGPKLKRFRPGSRGVAQPYSKRMSHIRIILETVEKPKVVKDVTSQKESETKEEKTVEEKVTKPKSEKVEEGKKK